MLFLRLQVQAASLADFLIVVHNLDLCLEGSLFQGNDLALYHPCPTEEAEEAAKLVITHCTHRLTAAGLEFSITGDEVVLQSAPAGFALLEQEEEAQEDYRAEKVSGVPTHVTSIRHPPHPGVH